METTGEAVCVWGGGGAAGGGGGEGRWWGGGGGGGGGQWLKPVLLARNRTLNSDAAPNYKYVVHPQRGPLPHT